MAWPLYLRTMGYLIARILFRNINPALRYQQRLTPRHGQCGYILAFWTYIVLLLYSLLLPHTLFFQNTCKKHLIVCILSTLKPYSIILENKKWVLFIPNGCLDAYEVKVNIDIFKYQEKIKLISQFQRFFSFFNGLLEFASLPWRNCKNTLKCLHPLGM